MYAPHEEAQILRGIDEIMTNMRHVPMCDLAHFLVKFSPKLAEELSTQLDFAFYDEKEGYKHA